MTQIPVTRLGPCLAICWPNNPRCVVCDKVVATGLEQMEKLRSGEVTGICHVCDPNTPRLTNARPDDGLDNDRYRDWNARYLARIRRKE